MKNQVKALLALLLSLPCLPAQADTAGNIRFIVDGCHKYNFTKAQCAYVLATVEHETNGTFQPVREAYWLSETWRRQNLRYYPEYGRGYVQLTWLRNYIRMQSKLNIELVPHYDNAMIPTNARAILFVGLRDGDFTGYRLSQFIINSLTHARRARLTVNGLDQADKIAQRSYHWFSRLTVY